MMMVGLTSFIVVLSSIIATDSFLQTPLKRRLYSSILSMQTDSDSSTNSIFPHSLQKPIIIELVARKEISSGKQTQSGKEIGRKKQSSLKSRATAGVYKEKGDTIMEKLVDSPISTLASFLLNPTTLVLVVYLCSVAWGQVSWIQVRLIYIYNDD